MNIEDPASVPGTPQAAVAQALDEPTKPPVDLAALRKGNRLRKKGLTGPMPKEFGGGEITVRPNTAMALTIARTKYMTQLRLMPSIKKEFPGDKTLAGKAATELSRHLMVVSILKWRTDAPVDVSGDGDLVQPGDLSIGEVRGLIMGAFLPVIDLTDLDDDGDEALDMAFFLQVQDLMEQASNAPAAEIARLGERFRLAAIIPVDYND